MARHEPDSFDRVCFDEAPAAAADVVVLATTLDGGKTDIVVVLVDLPMTAVPEAMADPAEVTNGVDCWGIDSIVDAKASVVFVAVAAADDDPAAAAAAADAADVSKAVPALFLVLRGSAFASPRGRKL